MLREGKERCRRLGALRAQLGGVCRPRLAATGWPSEEKGSTQQAWVREWGSGAEKREGAAAAGTAGG